MGGGVINGSCGIVISSGSIAIGSSGVERVCGVESVIVIVESTEN